MTLTPIPHEEATRSIEEKPALTRAVWDRLHPDLQARAYTISGVECLDAIARVRELTARLPSGGDYAALKSQILSEISPWLVDPTADDATQAKQSAAAKRRAELLLRLHGWSAYAQTNHALAEAHIDVFPYRQYLSSEDSRVRPSHAALNKKILPAKHPFWANHTPPWEFNCRCDFAVMTEEEAQGIGAREKNLPDEDKKLMPPSQLRLMEEQNIIVKPGAQGFLDIRTPRQKGGGKGYEFRPGDNALPLNQILERFTPSERSTFQAWSQTVRLANGVTLAEYWGAVKETVTAATTAVTPTRSITALTSALQSLTPEFSAAQKLMDDVERQRKALRDRWIAAVKQGDESEIEAIQTLQQENFSAARNATAEMQKVIERARTAIELPADQRGTLTLTGSKPMLSKDNIKEGKKIVERYTHRDYMPEIEVVSSRGRAYHKMRKIYVNGKTDASVIAHEIMHGVEIQNPELLQASIDFLNRRAGAEPAKSLRKMTGLNYDSDEFAWEDDWVKRGGDVYTGKDYKGRATEILTMGIERLHKNPYEFANTDPEYFAFVMNSLQKITP
jgi:SPP1 gp7 family putative phage head morphogenesis protein